MRVRGMHQQSTPFMGHMLLPARFEIGYEIIVKNANVNGNQNRCRLAFSKRRSASEQRITRVRGDALVHLPQQRQAWFGRPINMGESGVKRSVHKENGVP